MTIIEKRVSEREPAEWHATVEVDGKRYWVSHGRGKSVRIAFKPRGQNRGYHWYGTVRDENGRTIWSDANVGKSTGVQRCLEWAGLVRERPAMARKRLRRLESARDWAAREYQRNFSTRRREESGQKYDEIARDIEAFLAEYPEFQTTEN